MVLDTISSEDLLSIFCKLNLNCQLYLKLAKVPVVARGIKKLNFFKLVTPGFAEKMPAHSVSLLAGYSELI